MCKKCPEYYLLGESGKQKFEWQTESGNVWSKPFNSTICFRCKKWGREHKSSDSGENAAFVISAVALDECVLFEKEK